MCREVWVYVLSFAASAEARAGIPRLAFPNGGVVRYARQLFPQWR